MTDSDPMAEVEAQSNEPDVDRFDTPTQRATINMLDVDTLDAVLEQIRERRLQTVRKLEQAAKVKADEVRLAAFLKFNNQYKRAKQAIARLDEAISKAEAQVHRARLLALAAELEVGDDSEDDDEGTSAVA